MQGIVQSLPPEFLPARELEGTRADGRSDWTCQGERTPEFAHDERISLQEIDRPMSLSSLRKWTMVLAGAGLLGLGGASCGRTDAWHESQSLSDAHGDDITLSRIRPALSAIADPLAGPG